MTLVEYVNKSCLEDISSVPNELRGKIFGETVLRTTVEEHRSSRPTSIISNVFDLKIQKDHEKA